MADDRDNTIGAKPFADLVRERPDIFDDMDARPGPSSLSEEYSDSLIPEFLRERMMPIRRRRRAELAREQRLRPSRDPKTD
jgi:hypothetical protein